MRRWFAGGDRTLWVLVGAVAVGAAAVLGVLAARGSWYADDLDFLIHGSRGFGLDELLAPVNDHIAPGLRLVYAVFAAVAPLNYGFTVAVRVVLWAGAVALMAALAQRCFHDRRATVVATIVYALSPLAMPSFMSLSSAVNNLPAHVLGLVSLHCALDWFERQRWLSLLAGALSVFASALFWEKSALVVVTGAALGLMRVAQPGMIRRLLLWVAGQVVAVGAFASLYLALTESNGGELPTPQALLHLLRLSLERSVVPWFAGGPWSWHASSPPYFGFAAPPPLVIGLGVGIAAVSLLLCLARYRAVLWLWAAVLVHASVTVAVVAYGRFATFGETMTMHYHYWSDASIPLALVMAGTLAALARLPWRWPVAATSLVAAVWVIVTIGSFAGFASLWARNPSGVYISHLASALNERGRTNLWDTAPPPDVMPVISNNRRVSGITRLLGDDARFEDTSSEPYLVADDGRVVPSKFVEWGSARVPADCKLTLHQEESVTLPLSGTLPEGRWFARIGYLANPQADVKVELRRHDGVATALRSGTEAWPAGLAMAYLAADREGSGSEIVLTTSGADTNLCIGSVSIGLVEPAS